jgi:hypothetical protein
MSTVSRVQHLLGVIAHARVNNHPVQMITPRVSNEPAAVQATPAQPIEPIKPAIAEAAATSTWDPHDVWVNRVKKPRERRSA